jgi:hypothetical protein
MRLANFRRFVFAVVSWVVMCLVAVAQEKPTPPPDVDKALRERVTEFMGYTRDKTYRKAYEMVAEETKDWYLNSAKSQYTAYTVLDIEYSPDFQQAKVQTKLKAVLSMGGHDVPTEIVATDQWRFEDGKWMWYHNPNVYLTPFGEIPLHPSKKPADAGAAPIPKVDPSSVAARAKNITMQLTTDKDELVFDPGNAGEEEEVSFHNGLQGLVVVNADIVGDYRSFSVEPAQKQVQAGEDAVFKVHYKPSQNPSKASVRLDVDPFNRALMVPIRIKGSAPVAQ